MIVDAYASDPSVQNLPKNPPAPWLWQDDLLLYNSLVCVPHDDVGRLAFLQLHPDSPLAGHFGTAKTVELLSRNYYFPGMTAYVKAVPRVSEHGQAPFQSPAPVVIPGLPFVGSPTSFLSQFGFVVQPPRSRIKLFSHYTPLSIAFVPVCQACSVPVMVYNQFQFLLFFAIVQPCLSFRSSSFLTSPIVLWSSRDLAS